MSNYLSAQSFHLVGIKGVAMTALALILKDLGKKVTGCDVSEVFQTDAHLKAKQIPVEVGFNQSHLDQAEVVVYSASHQGSNNPEVVAAKKSGKKVCALPQLVGELTALKKNVAVSGCHGKTTTTALISYAAAKAGLDPSFFVGSASFMDYPSGHWGEGDLFVTEADEYLTDPLELRQSKFLFFHPQFVITTNLDYDHPDFFPNMEAIETAFLEFYSHLQPGGKLIINGDDERLLKLAQNSGKDLLTYGFNPANTYRLQKNAQSLEVYQQDKLLLSFTPSLAGRHNLYNLGAAIALFSELGVPLEKVKVPLSEFGGAKRRLELLAQIQSNLIIDDYGHHPTEMAASLSALRERYPDYKLALCFQPHTYSRTKNLWTEFVAVLKTADYVGLLPIFASARETPDLSISAEKLLQDLNSPRSKLLAKEEDWQKLVEETQQMGEKWLYVTMGAGDVYEKVGLLKKYLPHE